MSDRLTKLLAVAILLIVSQHVAAQSSSTAMCNVGQSAPPFGFWTWAPGSTVKLYIVDSDFEANDLSYLKIPVQNWNAVASATGSRVKFDYAGSTAAPVYCDNCLTIMRGPVFDRVRRHAAELQAYSARRDQILTWAHIVVDPTLTNPKAITNAVAHELGHGFGLLDCYRCKSNSTVMTRFKKFNEPNNMVGPTACDIAQVNAAYKELVVRIRPAPPKVEIVDEGEEPVDDNTPLTPRKP
jgi:hypothetical protein